MKTAQQVHAEQVARAQRAHAEADAAWCVVERAQRALARAQGEARRAEAEAERTADIAAGYRR